MNFAISYIKNFLLSRISFMFHAKNCSICSSDSLCFQTSQLTIDLSSIEAHTARCPRFNSQRVSKQTVCAYVVVKHLVALNWAEQNQRLIQNRTMETLFIFK